MSRIFSRYIVLGLFNTVFGYFVFLTLFSLLQDRLATWVIFIISSVISISESFFVQKRFVWRSDQSWKLEALKFTFTFVVVFFINLAALSLVATTTGLDPRLAQLPILGIISIGLYITHKNWTFKSKV